MIRDLDFDIYEAIHQNKQLTEIYLGFDEIEWYYSKAKYSATCTEAIDFTLFDKTICGLLQIEEKLSLEQIGEILGFNVIDNPSEKKYKDIAEWEILKEALQSLQDFEMIDGGDIDFSYCTLTTIGREYVSKGKKFKTYENKNFELYFDNTINQHLNAKENFEFAKGIIVENNDCKIDFEDETFLKTFAKNQIPQIFNPEKLNSFKDVKCIDINHFKVLLYRIYLVDITDGRLKSFVFDLSSKSVNDFFSEFDLKKINEQTKSDFILSNYPIKDYDINDKQVVISLNDFQRRINLATEKSPEQVISILDEYFTDSLFIEPVIFLHNLSKFIENAKQEIWLLLKEISEREIEILKKIIANNKGKYYFIYLESNELTRDFYDQIAEEKNQFKNVYILLMDSVIEFNILFKTDNIIWNVFKNQISNIPISTNGNLHRIEKYFINRNITEFDIEENYLKEYRLSFAKEYFPAVSKKIKQFFKELNIENEIKKDKIEEIKNINAELTPFKNLKYYRSYFQDIERQKNQAIDTILQNRNLKIISKIEKLSKTLIEKEDPSINFIEKLEVKILKEKEECLNEEYVLFTELESKIKSTKKNIEIVSQRKSIIIDTNILLEEPNIIEMIGQQQIIIFSGKVIDELDNLKIKPGLKQKAQNAIRNIHKHQQSKNIRFNVSKVENLPRDFDKKSPDNIILSVALQYKKRNPIILTNDKGMSIKAKTLDIPAKNINELKTILRMEKQAKSKNNIRNNKSKK